MKAIRLTLALCIVMMVVMVTGGGAAVQFGQHTRHLSHVVCHRPGRLATVDISHVAEAILRLILNRYQCKLDPRGGKKL